MGCEASHQISAVKLDWSDFRSSGGVLTGSAAINKHNFPSSTTRGNDFVCCKHHHVSLCKINGLLSAARVVQRLHRSTFWRWWRRQPGSYFWETVAWELSGKYVKMVSTDKMPLASEKCQLGNSSINLVSLCTCEITGCVLNGEWRSRG